MDETSKTDQAKWARWRAVANLYHAFFTGLILTVVTRRGVPAAEEFVFRVFRRQQEERFLAGLEKLGLSKLPPAVAAAQYHYLSNWIGGVFVEYMYESDRKAWIRYPPPRWIWQGTAICGIPMEVSRAMLRGWHANNGVALRNLKLGFVCTKQTVDVQDGLEGYYYEYDRDLGVDERLVFARHLEAPPFDPARAPALPVDAWPKPRLEKAYRNYAMEYVRSAAPVMVQLFGAEDAGHLLHRTAKLIGMQFFPETAAAFSEAGSSSFKAVDFAAFLSAVLSAQDDRSTADEQRGVFAVTQHGWRLMIDVADYHPACGQVLTGLFEGLAAASGRNIGLAAHVPAVGRASDAFVWTVRQR
ncbi:hypothetical protein [Bradyrhizobium sp. LHD-71]|uniref:hypothetical protein n=1 Tax=Bradyrhizobium sp. LHD-71 TaxID=3072141 RepID=UPI00280CCC50|nr:hypothetical protein [Bradyrhizobium sp. LHD-71]MDQ8729916.1 hypothetical protein [Bradyrhizobium sp. LHD-71]